MDNIFDQNRVMRIDRFAPYINGRGLPEFELVLYEPTGTRAPTGQLHVPYEFFEVQGDHRVLLFRGTDFGCSPVDTIDGDACVAGILNFLTLRPGDTDPEFFMDYTQLQMDFAMCHGEVMNLIQHGPDGTTWIKVYPTE